MVWGDKPIDTTATAEFERLDRTMSFAVVGDEDLASMAPARTLTDQPAKYLAAHRRPPRAVLTWRGTVAAASAVGAGVFVVLLMLAGSGSPAPATSHQAAPEGVTVLSPSPTKAKVKRPSERRAEPVVLRSEPPARVAVPRITITITAKATATPKPTTPSPTKSVKPSPTSSATPVIPVTTDPEPTTPPASDEAQTTDAETPDDDA